MGELEENLLKIIEKSSSTFLSEEASNIINQTNERNLCGRLAISLNDLIRNSTFSKYYVDTEYNRKQKGEVKTILDHEHKVIQIQCDILVHSRGENKSADNLIAIEMKKSNRLNHEKNSDRNRLRAMTKDSYDGVWSNDGITDPEHVCGYIIGAYLELDIKKRLCLFEIYRKGSKILEWGQQF